MTVAFKMVGRIISRSFSLDNMKHEDLKNCAGKETNCANDLLVKTRFLMLSGNEKARVATRFNFHYTCTN